MNIAITYNLENKKHGFVSADYDSPETIKSIKQSLQEKGYGVHLVEANENAYEKFKRLKSKKQIDLVFNYSLGIFGPCRQAHIPAMLEMLQIPYTGCDAATIALCQNKVHVKEILLNYGVKTANFQVFGKNDKVKLGGLKFPLIIKCLHEDSSIGLEGNFVVSDLKDLKKGIKKINQEFKQSALVEEYLDGREFTFGALGNLPDLFFLKPLEIMPSPKKNKKHWIWERNPKFVGSKVSEIKKYADKYSTFYVCPVINLSPELENKMKEVIKKVYQVIGVQDFTRIDFRVVNNEPYLLEVNNCCHLARNGSLVYKAKASGLSYSQLINKITTSAIKRLNLK